MKSHACWICTGSCTELGRAEMLGRSTLFFKCERCGSVRTEEPSWLSEAYSRPTPDLGLVDRNLQNARNVRLICHALGGKGRVLDFGGGSGLLVRLLRDRGLDAWWYDPMATNDLARGFEARLEETQWTAITAIEVLEHIPRTASVVKELLSVTDCLIVSTLPIPEPPPDFDRWWYYLLDEGQHVSFPTVRGLRIMAESNGATLLTSGSTHVMLRTSRTRAAIIGGLIRGARVVSKFHSLRRSLLTQDAERVAGLKVDRSG